MTTTSFLTGIELVDRELKRHEPFPSADEAKILAAKLLSVWRALHPSSNDIIAPLGRSQARRR